MRIAEPVQASWKAHLALDFESRDRKTVLARKHADGPLVVQKPLYPEGPQPCHVIVVHPPGGIAGGDELTLEVKTDKNSSALLTTPGAGKWYRSAGPWASQRLSFAVDGVLEWLPRETIVFDGALASLHLQVNLGSEACYIGWEVVCLGRTGSGEKFERGEIRIETKLNRSGKPLLLGLGTIEGGGRLMNSPAGLGGRTVFGTLIAASATLGEDLLTGCRKGLPDCIALTLLPGVLVARYLGDSGEQAMQEFISLWKRLRPAIAGRPAVEPRIWST
jgi:urease accessory protein